MRREEKPPSVRHPSFQAVCPHNIAQEITLIKSMLLAGEFLARQRRPLLRPVAEF